MNNLPYIKHTTPDGRVTLCNSVQIIAFQLPGNLAYKRLCEFVDADTADAIMSGPDAPLEIWQPTYLSALGSEIASVGGQVEQLPTVETTDTLRAELAALTDYVGDLASEIEVNEAAQFLRKHLAALENQIEQAIPVRREYIANNTIVLGQLTDDFVRNELMRTTKVGQEITKLRSLLQ